MDAQEVAEGRRPDLSIDWPAARARCLREARRIVASEHDAEEVVQEALIRAWRMRRSCRNPEAPLAWLLQITRNEALRRLTRRAQRAEVPVADPVERVGHDDGHDALIGRLAVRSAVATLKPRDRVLLELRYGHDLTQPRVAELIGVPEGTVKTNLHRARKQLREVLGDALD